MGKLIWSIFWALVGIFIIFVSFLVIGIITHLPSWIPLIILATWFILLVLGRTLLFVSKKTKVSGELKKFLILTGASAMVTPIIVLIAIVVGMGSNASGPGALFVIIILCAMAFIAGVLGTIGLALKNK